MITSKVQRRAGAWSVTTLPSTHSKSGAAIQIRSLPPYGCQHRTEARAQDVVTALLISTSDTV